MRWLDRFTTAEQDSWLQVVKVAVAIAVAWFASRLLLEMELPIFAAIAALLVVAPSVNQSLAKGIGRSVGVIGGVLLAWLATLVLPSSSLVVLAVTLLAVVLARALRLAPMAANQLPISAMILLALGAGAGPLFGFERVVETVIGAAVALVINLVVVPPVHHEPAERTMRELAHAVADAYERAADALSSADAARGEGMLAQARELRAGIKRTRAAMDALEDSVRLNPRARLLRDRIARDERLLLTLTVLVNRVIGISRSIADRFDVGLVGDPTVRRIAAETRRIASEVRALVDRQALEDGRTATLPTVDGPRLTEPIPVPRPHPSHWVLIGALLEDVRQARESLEAGADAE
ncbi:aromatic acid exporter family protein [Agrococcus sp. HG114]|uniref:FUSC family protein n=1 Tax=Agrococcus sp. HG114 TaxID=2969757 RepID=UPI00215ADB93|nr:FUSC family protein [Agrococcus sp. HG114]MCR8670180.1 FUSC family protein [Agrococcus sp. HG114]